MVAVRYLGPGNMADTTVSNQKRESQTLTKSFDSLHILRPEHRCLLLMRHSHPDGGECSLSLLCASSVHASSMACELLFLEDRAHVPLTSGSPNPLKCSVHETLIDVYRMTHAFEARQKIEKKSYFFFLIF